MTIVCDAQYNANIVCDAHYKFTGKEKKMDTPEEILNGLLQELRRGTIVMCVLAQLKKPHYGYSLVQSLTEAGMPTEAGTLYPLLRRLEKQGLLKSEWETGGAKPRKYYVITPQGTQIYENLYAQWEKLAVTIEQITDGGAEQ